MAEPDYHALYFNGLNKGTLSRSEKRAISVAARGGIQIKHISVDWQSNESFNDLLSRITRLSKNEVNKYEKVLLIGASAGGSLAINTFARLHESNVRVVTLCSRLREVDLPWWDLRSLNRMAHIGTNRESQSFVDSIIACSERVLPMLTAEDKRKVVTVKQWADEVVPRQTMNIKGLRSFTVPGFGHHHGINSGIRHLKIAIELLEPF